MTGFTRGDTTVGGTGETFDDAIERIDDELVSLDSRLDVVEVSGPHSHTNKAVLDLITDEGSTAIITTAERFKLSGIETSATADQTGAEIRTALAAEPDTHIFNDLYKNKVDGIETAATRGGAQVQYVRQASDLAGSLDSNTLYVIDGVIDMGSQSIEVPAGGLSIRGYTFDISGLTSTAAGYSMFTSPIGGSGNLLIQDCYLTTSGTGSEVYNLVSDTGNEAVELARVNFNGCTSLGTLDNFRQGLETGTGRFGGTPDLTLAGAWSGGYFIETSITRGLDNTMAPALFVAGAGFTMASRFRSNMNVDLGTLAPLVDFSPANFPNANTLQLEGMIVTRNGVVDSTDSTILPNIARADLASRFVDNIGISNTFVGGEINATTEIATVINTIGVYETLAGTWTATDLQHFDSPANGQLRHLGDNPIDFKVIGDLVIDGVADEEVDIRIRKWDDSASSFVTVGMQGRRVNNLQGGRDVAVFNFNKHVTMDQNDYIFLEVANLTTTANVTAEIDSTLVVEAR